MKRMHKWKRLLLSAYAEFLMDLNKKVFQTQSRTYWLMRQISKQNSKFWDQNLKKSLIMQQLHKMKIVMLTSMIVNLKMPYLMNQISNQPKNLPHLSKTSNPNSLKKSSPSSNATSKKNPSKRTKIPHQSSDPSLSSLSPRSFVNYLLSNPRIP